MEDVTDPESLEAMACREGLALASDDLLLRHIRLATDCLGVVRSLREEGMGPYGHIVREIKARGAAFQSFELVHEGRRSNTDAHNLAKSSIYANVGRHVWLLSPPEGIVYSTNFGDVI